MYTLVSLVLTIVVALVIGGILTYLVNTIPQVPAPIKSWIVWLIWAIVIIWLLLFLLGGSFGGTVYHHGVFR